jgi:hypothetical protein
MIRKYNFRKGVFFELEMDGETCLSCMVKGSHGALRELVFILRDGVYRLPAPSVRIKVAACVIMGVHTAWFFGTDDVQALRNHGALVFHDSRFATIPKGGRHAELTVSDPRDSSYNYSLDDVMRRLVELGILKADNLHIETEPETYSLII